MRDSVKYLCKDYVDCKNILNQSFKVESRSASVKKFSNWSEEINWLDLMKDQLNWNTIVSMTLQAIEVSVSIVRWQRIVAYLIDRTRTYKGKFDRNKSCL